ncbi:hypothetical protein SPRG_13934 [Saprolegnia parasitica CBS 223.65]|uniref:RNI-like protein n=1 Tax=Saprolegnia parasitica (strain CBS 223.65) TaxID=695850 RepID=A0A067C360_SAPPC|nr:hypothetical protein SPRG_13934 [Saprolegnia parasitica CBS 223.65]KDO21006.1 hypothetical protein SPRG_13934 [Saprolegnia parasitica CBS 223.65]|eukprot:XP_012208258.1 hypothetical protein SPRG_13934 [Saprolegnia parasitica CBS 223.65]
MTSATLAKRQHRPEPDTMLLSPELLEAIATYVPVDCMTAFLEALPKQLRTPALQLATTLSHALGLEVLWPTLDVASLTQLANADNVLAQLLIVNPRLCIESTIALPVVPVVATLPRAWPTLERISLTITTWTMDARALATVQQVFLANAASLQSIDVCIAARPIPPPDERYATQSAILTGLADLLVSMRRVTKLALRGAFKVRFPDEAAATLAAWIQATPLTSLTMTNVDEGSGSTLSRHLTHLDLQLLPPSQMSYVVGRLVNSALVSLHVRASNEMQGPDGRDEQCFLDDDLPRLNRLTTLRLTNIHLSTTHCLTLALLLPRYSHLGLTSNKLRDAGVLALAPFLRHTSQLETLSLVNQSFGDVGASALSTALVHTPRLRTLDLSRNNIKRAGAMALSCLLAHLPRLATVRLQGNPLDANGVVALLLA